MTMFGTIFTGTSGLLTYSKGLNVVSNNVANMNTTGFKRSDLVFRDLFYGYEYSAREEGVANSASYGSGVGDKGTTTSFAQGDLRQTGRSMDVAIDGNGFFILQKSDTTFYTRAGQFQIDSNGALVSAINGASVLGLSASGGLEPISISSLRVKPATATTRVSFIDNLSSGSSEHKVENIVVYDASGQIHTLSLTLRKNTIPIPGSWLAEVRSESGLTLATGQELRFQANGAPDAGFNAFTVALPGGSGAHSIEFHFGDPGSFNGATSFSGGTNSTLAMSHQNGRAAGTLTSVGFNESGVLSVAYSNGETASGPQLAMAWTDDLQALKQVGDGLFLVSGKPFKVGAPNSGSLGAVVGGSIESSNVEVSQEFTDLIIVQRGFQVCSQVVTIANEMVQQLLESAGNGR